MINKIEERVASHSLFRMFCSLTVAKLVVALLLHFTLAWLPAYADEFDGFADSIPIGKGKWQCDYKPQKKCTWGNNQSNECVEMDGQEWSFAGLWFELDLSDKPIKLYFCSKTGCATGRFEDGKITVLTTLGGVLGYEGAMGRLDAWTAVFPVEIGVDLYLESTWYMFRVHETASTKILGHKQTPSSLTIVYDTSMIYLVGQCEAIDNLSKLGNPLRLYKGQDSQEGKLNK
jgi:hypothetical protein